MTLGAKIRYLKGHPAFRRAPALTLARLSAWRIHCALNLAGNIKLPNGGRLRLPAEWKGVAKLLYAFRSNYEPELHYLIPRLQPGMVFVDVGAAYGVYTVAAARAVGPAGLVLAFEPALNTFGALTRNVELNGLANVRLFCCALADRSGRTLLLHNADPSRNRIYYGEACAGEGEMVVVETLDQILEDLQAPRLDAIKIDTEGAEALVLVGARRSLERFRPAVVFEVNPDGALALGLQGTAAWGFLAMLRYGFFKVHPTEGLIKLDEQPSGGNVLALPL